MESLLTIMGIVGGGIVGVIIVYLRLAPFFSKSASTENISQTRVVIAACMAVAIVLILVLLALYE